MWCFLNRFCPWWFSDAECFQYSYIHIPIICTQLYPVKKKRTLSTCASNPSWLLWRVVSFTSSFACDVNCSNSEPCELCRCEPADPSDGGCGETPEPEPEPDPEPELMVRTRDAAQICNGGGFVVLLLLGLTGGIWNLNNGDLNIIISNDGNKTVSIVLILATLNRACIFFRESGKVKRSLSIPANYRFSSRINDCSTRHDSINRIRDSHTCGLIRKRSLFV